MKKVLAIVLTAFFVVAVSSLTGCVSAADKINSMTTLRLNYTPHEVVQAKVFRVYTNLAEKHKYITDFDTYFPNQYKNDVMAKVILSNFAYLVVRYATVIVPPGMILHKGDIVEVQMGHEKPDFIPARVLRIVSSSNS